MGSKIKIALAAIAVAGSLSWITGFAAESIVAPKDLEENAVKIATSSGETAVAAKPTGPEPILALLAGADVNRGKVLAKACAACHSFDKGGKNGVGPNLYGVVGHKKQSVAGFSYSGTLAEQGGDVWTYSELSKFIYKPKAYAAGTKMGFAGLKKTEDRANLIAYLRTLSDAPVALPTADEIAAEVTGK